jgi:hypothetical protein
LEGLRLRIFSINKKTIDIIVCKINM